MHVILLSKRELSLWEYARVKSFLLPFFFFFPLSHKELKIVFLGSYWSSPQASPKKNERKVHVYSQWNLTPPYLTVLQWPLIQLSNLSSENPNSLKFWKPNLENISSFCRLLPKIKLGLLPLLEARAYLQPFKALSWNLFWPNLARSPIVGTIK